MGWTLWSFSGKQIRAIYTKDMYLREYKLKTREETEKVKKA